MRSDELKNEIVEIFNSSAGKLVRASEIKDRFDVLVDENLSRSEKVYLNWFEKPLKFSLALRNAFNLSKSYAELSAFCYDPKAVFYTNESGEENFYDIGLDVFMSIRLEEKSPFKALQRKITAIQALAAHECMDYRSYANSGALKIRKDLVID